MRAYPSRLDDAGAGAATNPLCSASNRPEPLWTTSHTHGIATLQGATELFPVSSLGHAVVLPALLHWGIDQNSPEFLPFLVMLHLGTATALLGYFWKDWWAIL